MLRAKLFSFTIYSAVVLSTVPFGTSSAIKCSSPHRAGGQAAGLRQCWGMVRADQSGLSRWKVEGGAQGSLMSVWSCQIRIPATCPRVQGRQLSLFSNSKSIKTHWARWTQE